MEKEMLPGNHKDKLPLIFLPPPSHTIFCGFSLYTVYPQFLCLLFNIPRRGDRSAVECGALVQSLWPNSNILELKNDSVGRAIQK